MKALFAASFLFSLAAAASVTAVPEVPAKAPDAPAWYTAADAPLSYKRIIPFTVDKVDLDVSSHEISTKTRVLAINTAGYKYDAVNMTFMKDADEKTKGMYWFYVVESAARPLRAFTSDAAFPKFDDIVQSSDNILLVKSLGTMTKIVEQPGFPNTPEKVGPVKVGGSKAPSMMVFNEGLIAVHDISQFMGTDVDDFERTYTVASADKGKTVVVAETMPSAENCPAKWKVETTVPKLPTPVPAKTMTPKMADEAVEASASVQLAFARVMKYTHNDQTGMTGVEASCLYTSGMALSEGRVAIRASGAGYGLAYTLFTTNRTDMMVHVVAFKNGAESNYTGIKTSGGSVGILSVYPWGETLGLPANLAKDKKTSANALYKPANIVLSPKVGDDAQWMVVSYTVMGNANKGKTASFAYADGKYVDWTLADAGKVQVIVVSTQMDLADDWKSASGAVWYGGTDYSYAPANTQLALSSMAKVKLNGEVVHYGFGAGRNWTSKVSCDGLCMMNADRTKAWQYTTAFVNPRSFSFLPDVQGRAVAADLVVSKSVAGVNQIRLPGVDTSHATGGFLAIAAVEDLSSAGTSPGGSMWGWIAGVGALVLVVVLAVGGYFFVRSRQQEQQPYLSNSA